MYPAYRDLREKLGAPIWTDSNGVPRYAKFHPKLLGVYDTFAILFDVQCQSCGMRFDCANGTNPIHAWLRRNKRLDTPVPSNAELNDPMRVFDELLGWGDAPYHDEQGHEDTDDGQCSGVCMSTDIVAILGAWIKKDFEWERYELTLAQGNQLLGIGAPQLSVAVTVTV